MKDDPRTGEQIQADSLRRLEAMTGSPRVPDAMAAFAARAKKFFVPVTYDDDPADTLAVRMCKKIYNITGAVAWRGTPITRDELRAIHGAAFTGLDWHDYAPIDENSERSYPSSPQETNALDVNRTAEALGRTRLDVER